MHLVFVFVLLVLPTFVFAAPRTFLELADLITNLINGGIGVALILGIVVYFWGIVATLPQATKGQGETLRKHLMWGMVALFVMFSIWGILGLLRNTLFSGGRYDLGSNSREQVFCESLDNCGRE